MNYSELNDYQINNLVHNIIVCGGKYSLTFADGYDIRWIGKSDGLVVKTGKQSYGSQLKNYCNSWADAGPVILENRISIVAQAEDWCAEGRGVYPVPDINPLRAAMIVFLMMQEAK